MILMKGDAWQACILSLHLGTQGGWGERWFPEPPSHWLPVRTRDV